MSETKSSPFSARACLAHNVRRVRLARGWSQGLLAETSGLHLNTVGALERGLLNASVDVIEKLALALEVPFIELFQEGNSKHTDSD